MDGAASDLRTGLPWQMTELHEPVRCLFIIETTAEALQAVIERNPGIKELVVNDWIQLAVLDPNSPAIRVYRNGRFEPYSPETADLPVVSSSIDWYRGWREHLGYASVVPDSGADHAATEEAAA
jgi:uncharacterized protein